MNWLESAKKRCENIPYCYCSQCEEGHTEDLPKALALLERALPWLAGARDQTKDFLDGNRESESDFAWNAKYCFEELSKLIKEIQCDE